MPHGNKDEISKTVLQSVWHSLIEQYPDLDKVVLGELLSFIVDQHREEFNKTILNMQGNMSVSRKNDMLTKFLLTSAQSACADPALMQRFENIVFEARQCELESKLKHAP